MNVLSNETIYKLQLKELYAAVDECSKKSTFSEEDLDKVNTITEYQLNNCYINDQTDNKISALTSELNELDELYGLIAEQLKIVDTAAFNARPICSKLDVLSYIIKMFKNERIKNELAKEKIDDVYYILFATAKTVS